MTKPLNQEYFVKDETLGASTNRSFHVFHINLICKFQKCIYKDDLSSKAFCFPPTLCKQQNLAFCRGLVWSRNQ